MTEADRAPIIQLSIDQEVFIDTVRDGDTVEDATVATEVTSFDRVGDAYVLEGAIVFAGYLARDSQTGSRDAESAHALTLDFDETEYAEHVHHRMPFVLRVPVTAQSRGIVNVTSRISTWKLDAISAGWMRVVADLSVVGLNGNMGYHFQCGAQEAGNLFFEQDWLDSPQPNNTADNTTVANVSVDGAEVDAQQPAQMRGDAEEPAQEAMAMRGDAEEPAQEAMAMRGDAEESAQEAMAMRGDAEEPAQEATAMRGDAEEPAQEAMAMRGDAEEPTDTVTSVGGHTEESSAITDAETEPAMEPSSGEIGSHDETETASGEPDSALAGATVSTADGSSTEREQWASMMRGGDEEDSSHTSESATSGYGDNSALYEAIHAVSEARAGHGANVEAGHEPDFRSAADELLRLDRALDGANSGEQSTAEPSRQIAAEEVRHTGAVNHTQEPAGQLPEQKSESAVFEFEHQVTSAEMQSSPEHEDQAFAASRSFGDEGFRATAGFVPTIRVGSHTDAEQTEANSAELRSEADGVDTGAVPEQVKVDPDLWSFVDFNAPETYFTLRYAIVADEETLDMVAERVGCAKSDLVRANHLNSDSVPPGFPLRVPFGRSTVNN